MKTIIPTTDNLTIDGRPAKKGEPILAADDMAAALIKQGLAKEPEAITKKK